MSARVSAIKKQIFMKLLGDSLTGDFQGASAGKAAENGRLHPLTGWITTFAPAFFQQMSELPALRARLSEVSHKPGVYLHKDRLGSIIYVGKAKDLRKRLSSYFMPSGKKRADRKTRALIDSICDFEVHEVRNEQEALLLE